ncbi:MAG TPA: hypothetical protein VNO20_08110 [Solirubrobacterales bacterium]|nr:hypothetical protein [Solirubrobacterales bacterium]
MIKPWIVPFGVMGIAALALGVFLNADRVGEAGYFVSLILYTVICGAYIAYHVAREEHPQPIRRALSKARRSTP